MKRDMRIRLFDKSIVLVVFISLFLFFYNENVDAALTTNLLHYYSMNSTSLATDDYGTNDGTANSVNQVTIGCRLQKCYSFAPSASYIELTNVDFSCTYSISAWVNVTTLATENTIISRWKDCSGTVRAKGPLRWFIRTNGTLQMSQCDTGTCNAGFTCNNWITNEVISV